MQSSTQATLARVVLPVCLALCSGCAGLNLDETISWDTLWEGTPEPPESVVAIWTPIVATHASRGPMRGFGGRLMFYGKDREKTIKVEGTLVVYAFDEVGRESTNVKPDRKYVFTPDQLAGHYSESKIGHTYTVWLPWDGVGGPKKRVSLITHLMSDEGIMARGEQTMHVLAGPAETTEPQVTDRPSEGAADPSVQRASYETATHAGRPLGSPTARPVGPQQRMQTTTFSLPPKIGRTPPALVGNPREPTPARPTVETSPSIPPREPAGATPNPVPSQSRVGVGAWTRPSFPPPPTRFSRSRSRALGAPIARLERDRVARQPFPAE